MRGWFKSAILKFFFCWITCNIGSSHTQYISMDVLWIMSSFIDCSVSVMQEMQVNGSYVNIKVTLGLFHYIFPKASISQTWVLNYQITCYRSLTANRHVPMKPDLKPPIWLDHFLNSFWNHGPLWESDESYGLSPKKCTFKFLFLFERA